MGHFFARSLPPRSNEMQRHRRDKKGYAIFLFRQTMSQELMSNGAFLIGCCEAKKGGKRRKGENVSLGPVSCRVVSDSSVCAGGACFFLK
mmetsp:Transcript_26518/g.67904  ORF Transcript_26518/g.67904 Transcript_26518/m.67904 type:complete len:90 (+) Transcript_26518:2904-3173(+)